jgi:hypothetical protein
LAIRNFFRRRQESKDLAKLKTGFAVLGKKTTEYFDEDEFDRVNIIELYIFWWVFNSTCYLMLKDNPSKSVLADFGQSVTSKITDQILTERNPNASSDEIDRFYRLVADLSAERQHEYIDLFQKEMNKPGGTSAFVGLTCSILNRLFGTEKDSSEIFDPGFSAILAEHINVFGKVIETKRSGQQQMHLDKYELG